MATRASEIVSSIRSQIPDPASTVDADGNAFTAATLVRWINDACRVIAQAAPVVQDWGAVQSTQNMDVYELNSNYLSIEQLWYDLWPCYRSPEADALFVSKVNSRSYFFGPHTVGVTPRLHVWPAADRTGATTTLTGAHSATASTLTVASTSSMKAYGFVQIDSEVIMYRTVTSSTVLSNLLRGQAGTTAAAHSNAATVTELNIFFKASRLPVAITTPSTDLIEIPQGLHPLVEVYVLSKVREAEQDHQSARELRQEFGQAIEALASKPPMPGLRQGIQVRDGRSSPLLWGGRVYVPALVGAVLMTAMRLA